MIPALIELLPERPYCTSDPRKGLFIRSRREALKMDHIQINLPWAMSTLLFDVDYQEAGACWLPLGLVPTWVTRNLINGHCHLAYTLETSVKMGIDSSPKPIVFLKDTLKALQYVLEADPHYSGLITKNPFATWQWGLSGSGNVYALADLQRAALQNIPSTKIDEILKPKKRVIDHVETPLQYAGRGERNVTLFNELRAWAYTEIRQFRGENRIFSDFFRSCLDQAEMMNSIIPESLGKREVVNLASSVSKWTFEHDPKAQALFSQKQAARGRKNQGKRKKNSKEALKPWEAQGVSRRTWYRHNVSWTKTKKEMKAFQEGKSEPIPDFFETLNAEKKTRLKTWG